MVIRAFAPKTIATIGLAFLLSTALAALSFEILERPVRMSKRLDRHIPLLARGVGQSSAEVTFGLIRCRAAFDRIAYEHRGQIRRKEGVDPLRLHAREEPDRDQDKHDRYAEHDGNREALLRGARRQAAARAPLGST